MFVEKVDGAHSDCLIIVSHKALPLSHCFSLPWSCIVPSIYVPSLALKSPSSIACLSGLGRFDRVWLMNLWKSRISCRLSTGNLCRLGTCTLRMSK